MGVYANYKAAPPEVVASYLDDFDGLDELCEAPGGPCRTFSLHKAWRVVWCTLEPEAFDAVVLPEREPSAPAGILGAAVVGARPLNPEHSLKRGEEFVGVHYHTRVLTAEEVQAAWKALEALTELDIERAYDSGTVTKTFGPHVVPAADLYGTVGTLRDFYREVAAEGMVVTVMIG